MLKLTQVFLYQLPKSQSDSVIFFFNVLFPIKTEMD